MTISVPCSPSSASIFSESSSRASTPTLVPSRLAPDDKFDDGRSITESMISSLASDGTDIERNSMYASNDELSFERLLVIHASLAVCLFLAITDTTIVSTSLPTINAELGGTSAQYSWVGLYADTNDLPTPIRTIHEDVWPEAGVVHLHDDVLEHILALWCGAVIARALQGVGGGGIVTLVWVILEEVAPAKSRQRWNAALSVVWSMSALAGPLMGGVFSGKSYVLEMGILRELACWLCCIDRRHALIKRLAGSALQQAKYDLFINPFRLGCILLVGGTASLVIGFSLATIASWSSALTLGLVFTGIASLALGAVYESGVFGATRCWGFSLGANPKHALFAPMLLRTRTAGIILVFSFFQTMSFNAGTFYLALYYQAVKGSSALHAGMQLLPYTLGSSLVSLVGFYISDRTKAHITMIRAGLGLMATGFGLMIFLDERSGIMVQTLIPLVAGVGVGLLLKTPATALSLAMRGCDVPAVTAGLLLVRFIGTASGVSIGGAIYQSRLAVNLPAEFSLDMSVPNFDYRLLTALQPESLRNNVLRAVSRSISSIWVVCAICLSIGFFLSLFLKQTPVDAASSSNDETHPSEQSSLLQPQFDQKNYSSIGTCKKGGI
ncbi:unnamed protein product [Rhizoctonia solani]|uniref:Major facilitator superfamily (MFS) profile domain-containing protein n=1 Tax=Rhizoctonia solani TaxID=456999 RepID=A0A8H2Y489_9AGAM|nr:unnamed protein product [Rhizoctonia solani]